MCAKDVCFLLEIVLEYHMNLKDEMCEQRMIHLKDVICSCGRDGQFFFL